MQNNKRSKKSLSWARLDNAAKIFPPTSYGADTGVFRLSCELTAQIEPDLLQRALDDTLVRFPHMLMVMRRGLFWYYLEQTTLRPAVAPEHQPPCAPLYFGSKSLLFEVSYWRRKVNVDVFHVLADGSGAIAFFQALIESYLALRHPESGVTPVMRGSVTERREDSFQKYYKSQGGGSASGAWHAFRLRGAKRADGGLNILEGVADVRQVLAAAHRYHTTLTVYLCAVLFSSIRGMMYVRDLRRPVVLTVPVDLRGYFPSDTARNFFGTIRVAYDFGQKSGTFEDIIASVAASFKEELTPERLATRMNKMSALEHNPILRPIPLALKNPVLRLSGDIAEMGETATISNVGRFHLPDALTPYVRGFSVFMSTHATQLCTCTFGNSLHFGFTSAFEGTELQRRFFEQLVSEGISVEIRSNEYYADTEEE